VPQSAHGYNAFSASCSFPGCDQPAPGAADGEISLCVEHERLRFYQPEEFAQAWSSQVTSVE
jgi:hypothetical protein